MKKFFLSSFSSSLITSFKCDVVVVVVVDTDNDDEDEEALLKASEESGKSSSSSSLCNKVVAQNRYHLVIIRLLNVCKRLGKTRDTTSVFPSLVR